MAERSEVLAQLARMLAADDLRIADLTTVRAQAQSHLSLLTDALLEEIAASDDVIDRESALFYLERRLDFLAAVLDHELLNRMRLAVQERLVNW